MAIRIEKLISKTNDLISTCSQDIVSAASLAGVVKSFTDKVSSVATIGDLPSAVDNKGRLIFVAECNSYRFSDGTRWTNDFCTRCAEFSLFTWGNNTCGPLGDGTTVCRCSPVREFCSATNWSQAAANVKSSFFIKENGEMWLSGDNCFSNLGLGTSTALFVTSPVREFCSSTNWVSIDGRTNTWAAIKSDGTMWVWGLACGDFALQILGDGSNINKCSPVLEFCSATNWCQVSVGFQGSIAVKTDGSLWAWGCVCNGTIVTSGVPVRESCSGTNWCRGSAGWVHSSAIKSDGSLWGWGQGTCGVIGDGTATNRSSAVREFCSATNWCSVSSGCRTTMAIKTDGSIWGWGTNNNRLGDGTTVTRCSPVREFCFGTDWCQLSLKTNHSLAIKTDGSLWAWGQGTSGQLGNGQVVNVCSPVREITSSTDWYRIFAGSNHSIGIKANLINGRGFL